MVKLNLLDLPDEHDDTRSFEAVEPLEAEQPTADFDFSFFQPEEDTSTVFSEPLDPPPPPPPPPPIFEEAPPQPTFEETITEQPRPNPFAVEDDFQPTFEEGVFEEDRGGSSNWLLYSVIALFLIGITAAGYWWTTRDGSSGIARRTPSTTTTGPVSTPPAAVDNGENNTPPPANTDPAPANTDNNNIDNSDGPLNAGSNASTGNPTPSNNNATPTTPPPNNVASNPTPSRTQIDRRPVPTDLRGQFDQNTGDNRYHLNYANRFLGVNSSHAEYSLLVITPGRVYLSVMGESRDDIARYRTEVKNSSDLATLHLKTEHAEVVFVDNQPKFLADLSAKIASQSAQPSTSGQGSSGVEQVRSDLTQMARNNSLSLTYFKQGEQLTGGRWPRYNVYSKVSGAKSSVLNFLEQLIQDMPEAKVNKISLYPTSGSTIGNGRMEARVEFTFYDGRR